MLEDCAVSILANQAAGASEFYYASHGAGLELEDAIVFDSMTKLKRFANALSYSGRIKCFPASTDSP
jgi:hypothetical protein